MTVYVPGGHADRLIQIMRLEQSGVKYGAAWSIIAFFRRYTAPDMEDPLPTDLPSGTVTFLFTDIEGSTRLWERDAAVMWRALQRHNALLGEAIRRHYGHHFKTIGDAFQAAFSDPADAVAACVTAQRALTAEPWPETGPIRVRMALHRGEADPSPTGDYLAPSLNRLARLLSAGHGGQVLISEAMRDAVATRLPEGASLLPLGRHRLRDLLDAEEVWQLVVPGLPSTFPPLKSLEGFPNNLPRQPSALIGRDDELTTLTALLAEGETRLLTLTGPGGIGKTRLALAAAAESLENFPDGVFFVALAGIEDAALLLPEIASVLGVREGGGLSLSESVIAYLTGKRLLLVLDNLEQLRPFEEAAERIATLLQAASTLRVLTTSRAPLRVRLERERPVPPLPIPEQVTETAGDVALAALESNPSVALFVDRARAARPAWSITRANAPAVAEIARRLEGLPLAIELAAARIRVLTPADIVKRLGGALDLLAARAGDRPDRQQTLRAAIAWSHDLLSFEHQAAFRRLGVFAGGFTLEAAETILAASPDPWVDGLDAVSILVEQSLIRAEEEPTGESRYRMLETIRAFALEALDDAGEGEEVRKAHAVWAEAFARDADSRVIGPDSAAWLDRYEREHDNVRAAMAWAIEHDPDYLGLRIPEALWQFWSVRGYYAEARTWIERSLAASSDAPPKLRALALDGLGIIAWSQGDLLVATTAFNEALATWRETGERRNVSGTLSNLGGLQERRGDYEQARAMHEEALSIVRELNDPLRLATVLNNLATAVWNTGDAARATALLEESVDIKRKQGNLLGLATSLSNLGMLAAEAGDLERAIAYIEETLAIDREVGNMDGIADSLHNLASLVVDQGDIARAAAFSMESLELRHAMGDRIGIAYSLENIAATVAHAGHCQAAARLFGAAERLREDLGAPLPPSERERYEEGVSICRDAGSATSLDGDWETGRGLALDDAVAEALHISRELAGTAAQGSGNLSATTTSE